MKKLIAVMALAAVIAGCGQEPAEQFKGAPTGANCQELYKEKINQDRCSAMAAEG